MTGDRHRATRFAARIGIALRLVADRPWGSRCSSSAAASAAFDAVWFIALGFLLAQGAKAAIAQTAFTERLAGVTVADIMDADPVTIPAGLPARRAYEDFFLRYQGWEWFAVVEEDGRFAGLAHRAAMEHAALRRGGGPSRCATWSPRGPRGSCPPTRRSRACSRSEPLRRLGALMAVDAEGRLRGVVTFEQVSRALRSRLAPPRLRRRAASGAHAARSATKASTTAGANWVPACRRSSASAAASGMPRPVGAVRGHGGEGVADEDDLGAERDAVAREAVRVAAAVPALVAGADELPDAHQRGRGLHDPLADQRVAAHERPLLLVERPALVQDGLRQGDLAHVVQLGGGHHAVDGVVVEAEAAGDGAGHHADLLPVAAEVRVPLVERAAQHAGRLHAGRDAPAVLLRVEAPVGDAERLGGVRAVLGQQGVTAGGADLEALAPLHERGARDLDERRCGSRPAPRARARRTRRRPCGRRNRARPRAACRRAPSRASSASPAGCP